MSRHYVYQEKAKPVAASSIAIVSLACSAVRSAYAGSFSRLKHVEAEG